jgi:cation diffusion facilitator CzcD-associated flavoprotein CzcO
MDPPFPHFRVVIAGAGFAGLGAAIRLQEDGEDDFILLERADDVGGTWRDNTYPGCACDVQSHLYSFSFAPNPDWSRRFSPQAEILDYLRRCAERFGILPHVRFGHDISSAEWHDESRRWRIRTSRGCFTADAFVVATGGLSDWVLPDIPGLAAFEGTVFHSARWNHDVDLANKRVAVVGTGASALQFVPEIQPTVGQLFVFQRTPPWVLPRLDSAVSERERRLFARLPWAQRATRAITYGLRELFVLCLRAPKVLRLVEGLARWHLARAIKDPALRRKLTPDYSIGCKGVLLSDDYYPALAQPNVHLVTDEIREFRRNTIVTADGLEREVDAVIFATGFRVTDRPIAGRIRGRGGILLKDAWRGSPRAHLGITVTGYPNLFLLLGPNTGLAHTSVVVMIESQLAFLRAALRFMRREGIATLEPRPEVQEASVAAVDRQLRKSVWSTGGCRSWYIDGTGRNSALWPSFTFVYRARVARFKPSEYVLAGSRHQPYGRVGYGRSSGGLAYFSSVVTSNRRYPE